MNHAKEEKIHVYKDKYYVIQTRYDSNDICRPSTVL
jgi:hypothetical protein